jgi:hypothetical protein
MHDHTTSVRLAREWAVIRRRPLLVERANTWSIVDGPVTSLDDVVRAVGGGGDLGADADRRLRRLVSLARTDDLAGRVAVARLTPGLLATARRHRNDPDAFEELLAAMWIAIRTFNPRRNPAVVAAALLSDAEYDAYRRRQRHRSASEVRVDRLEYVADDPVADPRDELAALLADASAAGMRRADLDLVHRLVATPRTEDVATQLAVTARTVRNRRDRVTAELRAIARAA